VDEQSERRLLPMTSHRLAKERLHWARLNSAINVSASMARLTVRQLAATSAVALGRPATSRCVLIRLRPIVDIPECPRVCMVDSAGGMAMRSDTAGRRKSVS
jgi:hypothetical protein